MCRFILSLRYWLHSFVGSVVVFWPLSFCHPNGFCRSTLILPYSAQESGGLKSVFSTRGNSDYDKFWWTISQLCFAVRVQTAILIVFKTTDHMTIEEVGDQLWCVDAGNADGNRRVYVRDCSELANKSRIELPDIIFPNHYVELSFGKCHFRISLKGQNNESNHGNYIYDKLGEKILANGYFHLYQSQMFPFPFYNYSINPRN